MKGKKERGQEGIRWKGGRRERHTQGGKEKEKKKRTCTHGANAGVNVTDMT